MDVWRIAYNMVRHTRSGQGDSIKLDVSELPQRAEAHASQLLWGFKSEEGLDHYAHVLNQHTLLVLG
jgi:hypothetical protein